MIMTQEDKELLLKDLCARLSYGVRVFVSGDDFDNYQYPYLLTAVSKFGQDIFCNCTARIAPYKTATTKVFSAKRP